MSRKGKRGRPFTFKLSHRRRLAELVCIHGARGAREVSKTSISVGTLLTIAREFGIELKKGRRPRKAA